MMNPNCKSARDCLCQQLLHPDYSPGPFIQTTRVTTFHSEYLKGLRRHINRDLTGKSVHPNLATYQHGSNDDCYNRLSIALSLPLVFSSLSTDPGARVQLCGNADISKL
jgi:hypothetical protein